MSIFNLDASNASSVSPQVASNPPLTLEDLFFNYGAETDPVTGRVNVSINGTTFDFNPDLPQVYKVDGQIYSSKVGDVYSDIANNLGLNNIISGGNLPEVSVVATRETKSESGFRYQDAIEPKEYNIGKVDKGDPDKKFKEDPTTPSLMNSWSLLKYRGTPRHNKSNSPSDVEMDYRKINLVDEEIMTSSSALSLINTTKYGFGPSYQLDFKDFALAKYTNKIPNNRLITLRRYVTPVEDDIITQERKDSDGKPTLFNFPPIAKAVTWFDDESTENKLSEILNLQFSLNTKPIDTDVQTITRSSEGGGLLNSFASKFSTLGSRAFLNGRGIAEQARLEAEGDSFDPLLTTYPNYILGPYNVIKDMLIRDSGLKFEHEIKLVFEYKLKYYPGTNPKILFLDQLANILALTYNSAPFWGGDVRYIGGYNQVTPPFGNLKLLEDGDLGGFMKSIFNDLTGFFNKSLERSGLGSFNLDEAVNSIKNGKFPNVGPLITNLIGGGLMNLINTPQAGQTIKSFLTGEATGQWHLTIGNPLNPIAMIGNLMCTGTTITFNGPMTLHDFPEEIRVEITLKPGRPRDKGEIESMFNCGRGRLYIEPAGSFTNGLDVSAERGSPLKAEQLKMIKQMSNG